VSHTIGGGVARRSCLIVALQFTVVCATVSLANRAIAANWSTEEKLRIGVVHTDNARRVQQNPENATVLQVTPTFSLMGQGNKAAALLRASVDYISSSGAKEVEVSPSLNGQFGASIIDRSLFVDSNILVKRVVVSQDSTSSNSLDIDQKSANTLTLNLTPRWEAGLGDSLNLLLSYGFNSFSASDDALLDSRSHRVNLTLEHGTPINNLALSSNFLAQRTDFEIGESLLERRMEIKAEQQLTATLNVDLSLGREWLEAPDQTPSTDAEPQTEEFPTLGFRESLIKQQNNTWDVGLTWRPQARTSLRASYGKRVFGTRPQLQLMHRMKRSDLSLSWSRDIRPGVVLTNTTGNADSNSDTLIGIGDDSGIDVGTGSDSDDTSVGVTTTDSRVTVDERIAAAFTLAGRVSNLRLESVYTEREDQFNTIRTTVRQMIFSAEMQRRLSRSVTGSVSYDHLRDRGLGAVRENRLGLALKFIF